ncbi:MAG TPA: YraN family protein [Bacteroidia bacterium]|nr:YraN family protein [Bacteroidia bacterium]
MAQHNELGNHGENLALIFLRKKNYQILESNWRWRKAEVDIIAKQNNLIIFVEVKTRSSDTFLKPEQAVHLKKQKMLKDAAEAYCEANALEVEIRFDIIAIIKEGNKTVTKHIESAF